MGLVPFIIQEVLQRDEQEGSEASFGRGDGSQRAFFQNMREKRLSQVLRFMDRMAAASNVGVKRRPVDSAQF